MVGLKAMLGCIGVPCGAAILHVSVCIYGSHCFSDAMVDYKLLFPQCLLFSW